MDFYQMLSTIEQVNKHFAIAQEYFREAMLYEQKAFRADQRGGVSVESMSRALEDAEIGSAHLRVAFNLIPQGCPLRQRYPMLMAQLGTVRIPNLRGSIFGNAMVANFFGGERGALCSGINRNMQTIQRCEQICAQQQSLLGAVTAQIQADMPAPLRWLVKTPI